MKKRIPLLCIILLGINFPIQAETSLAQKALKPVIEYQCGQELKDSKLWKASTYFMQPKNKAALEADVCECVGEQALKDVPTTTLLKATISEEAKNALTRQAISNTLKGCIGEFIK